MFKLEEVPLFSTLETDDLELLRKQIHIKRYAEGGIVFYEGEQSEYLHILVEGSVKLYKTSPKGTQVQINRFVAPRLIAEYASFEREPFPATCEFITDGAIGLLHFDTFYRYLKHPEFSLALIKSLTEKIRVLSSLVHKETILSSEAKVADLILNKIMIFNRLKNNEIASILNLTPETLSRILSKLKKEQIISVEKHALEVLDKEALKAIIENNTIKQCMDCPSKQQCDQEVH